MIIFSVSSASAFSGGDGSEVSPYQISNINELQDMKYDLSAHYLLVNDIDASGTINWNDGEGFFPLGDYFDRFTGTLDGQGYEVNGLYINNSSLAYVGFFSYITTDSIIENVSFTDINVNGGGTVGGLVAYNHYGTIVNSSVSGLVSVNHDYVGGLVGYNVGTIINSFFTGNISSVRDGAGGLVGYNRYDGKIIASSAYANITGRNSIGGLVGINRGNAIVTGTAFKGKVTGTEQIGGLVGFNDGSVVNKSYSNGTIISTGLRTGGLVGYNYNSGIISNSSSDCDIRGHGQTGGLVGYNNGGTITDTHSSGHVTGSDETGGLVGYSSGSGTISSSFSTGNVNSTGDRVGGLVGSNRYCTINNSYSEGNVNGSSNVGGLVGYDQYATIDASYSNGNVEGDGYYIGGLVGLNMWSEINNSDSTGDVLGDRYVGGLVGASEYGSAISISNSCSTGDVSGNMYVGGLVGSYRVATVSNSYSTGDVSGNSYVGGSAGYDNYGTMIDCYSIGDVSGDNDTGGLIGVSKGTVSNSYWDMDTSGWAYSAAGDGRTTVEMTYPHASNTYVNWNFDNIWSIQSGINDGYPYLRIIVDLDTPSTPTGLRYNKGNFYVHWFWNSGVNTDSFNVSVNDIWYNGTTDHYFNDTSLGPHDTSSIIVYAFNESKGKLSRPASSMVQLDNNPITITGLHDIEINETEVVAINAEFEDLDGDVPLFNCSRNDLFSNFSNTTGEGTWTSCQNDEGVYLVTFTVDDGHGSSDSQTIVITVNDKAGEPAEPEVVFSITDGTETVFVNDELTYTIGLKNTKSMILTNVTIVDELPAELTFVSSSDAIFDPNTNNVTIDVGTLVPGEEVTFFIEVKATTCGLVTNSAIMYCEQQAPVCCSDVTTVAGDEEIPEFSTIVIPMLMVIGFSLVFMRKRE